MILQFVTVPIVTNILKSSLSVRFWGRQLMIKLVRDESSQELPGLGVDDGVWSDPVADAIFLEYG